MLRLLLFIFTGNYSYLCKHEFKIMSSGKLFSTDQNQLPVGSWYDCQCSKCGTIKRFETS